MKRSNSIRLAKLFLAALSVNGLALAADSKAIGEPGRESGKANPLKSVAESGKIIGCIKACSRITQAPSGLLESVNVQAPILS